MVLLYIVTNVTVPSSIYIPRISPSMPFLYWTVTNSVPLASCPLLICINANNLDRNDFIAAAYCRTRSIFHRVLGPPPASINCSYNRSSVAIRPANYICPSTPFYASWFRRSSVKLYPARVSAALSTNRSHWICGIPTATSPSLLVSNNNTSYRNYARAKCNNPWIIIC